jgi:hypothetical protein
MNKTTKSILIGAIIGIIDVTPMIIQKLPVAADLSAFSLWVISAFIYSRIDIKINYLIKGMLVPILVLIPAGILIFDNNPASMLPIIPFTLVLGALMGWLMKRLV